MPRSDRMHPNTSAAAGGKVCRKILHHHRQHFSPDSSLFRRIAVDALIVRRGRNKYAGNFLMRLTHFIPRCSGTAGLNGCFGFRTPASRPGLTNDAASRLEQGLLSRKRLQADYFVWAGFKCLSKKANMAASARSASAPLNPWPAPSSLRNSTSTSAACNFS